ncbi:MAG: glutathione synthase/RimK-type ligase-like ATP-grasp enzyme [Planctomycetota bacterium]|jgi:glutathione synthase/RimK-type ligase-like ATP-grasp enzyme
MKSVVFATCRSMPGFQPDDVLIVTALEARGCTVTPAAWNESFEPFERADLLVVRSTWDYFDEAAAFDAWLQRLKTVPGVVCNAPSLMLWNSNKKYLLDLAERGAPLPPTKLSQPTAAALTAAMDELDLQEAVVKPVIGAGASGLTIMQRNDADSIERAAAALQCEGLVQPLIPEIRTLGETSCTFFAGEFSHAVVKRPGTDSILVQAEHGGRTEPASLTPEQLATARSMLDLLPEPAVFARVDMVLIESAPLLMEIEVIEPELFVQHDATAADRFASVLLG